MGRFKVTIRTKLLLLSIAVLSLPYVGYEYLREMERHLRDSLEASLIDTAIAVAGPLHEQAPLLPRVEGPVDNTLFVHKLSHPIQLDGYTDDWLSYISWSDTYIADAGGGPATLSFKFIISRYQQYFYALLQVNDDQGVFRRPENPGALDNDHVSLVFTSPEGGLKQYYFSPADSGEFSPFEELTRLDEYGFRYKELAYRTNIRAVWRQGPEGYNLELAIPVSVIGDSLGIVVYDVDDPGSREPAGSAGTAGPHTAERPGRILQSSPEIERIIGNYARTDGRRIWVLDGRGQVLASSGNLDKELPGGSVNFIYSLILPAVHRNFSDDLSGASRLQGTEINQALAGMPASRWRTSPDGRAVIVSAAAPVVVDGAVRGVAVIEEPTTSIQIQQRQAMASLFNKSLFVFLFVTLLLLFFATRLSIRIRRLERDAAAAIDRHGRVVGQFRTSPASDEIGDLSRNYAAMLDRLRHYNDYLENMASRLSHELRTPIAVVRSSLDQFRDTVSGEEKQTYLERAKEGVDRLNLIVVRLSEATRLEQALQAAEKEDTDLTLLVKNCVEGYRIAYPDAGLELEAPEHEFCQPVAADLIVQMLDKLVKNALDFKTGAEPVRIRLETGPADWAIHVANHGPPLPEGMAIQLFNSMISVRDKKQKQEPHLGLGLYIVRLIVEHHGGKVSARNRQDGQGVIFTARFPRL